VSHCHDWTVLVKKLSEHTVVGAGQIVDGHVIKKAEVTTES